MGQEQGVLKCFCEDDNTPGIEETTPPPKRPPPIRKPNKFEPKDLVRYGEQHQHPATVLSAEAYLDAWFYTVQLRGVNLSTHEMVPEDELSEDYGSQPGDYIGDIVEASAPEGAVTMDSCAQARLVSRCCILIAYAMGCNRTIRSVVCCITVVGVVQWLYSGGSSTAVVGAVLATRAAQLSETICGHPPSCRSVTAAAAAIQIVLRAVPPATVSLLSPPLDVAQPTPPDAPTQPQSQLLLPSTVLMTAPPATASLLPPAPCDD